MTRLRPTPKISLRIVGWAALVVFASIGTSALPAKVVFVVAAGLLLGSYREAWIAEGRFIRQMTVGFVPIKRSSWPLERFVEIQTRWDAPPAVEWSLLMGPVNWLFWHFFDWSLPWMGGGLELRLLGAKGWVQVWQGNSDGNFQANLEILERTTGLPVVRK